MHNCTCKTKIPKNVHEALSIHFYYRISVLKVLFQICKIVKFLKRNKKNKISLPFIQENILHIISNFLVKLWLLGKVFFFFFTLHYPILYVYLFRQNFSHFNSHFLWSINILKSYVCHIIHKNKSNKKIVVYINN